MQDILENYHHILAQIRNHEFTYHRPPHSVRCLAVSKTFPASYLRPLITAGHLDFGESYVQEALQKIRALSQYTLIWHFIGHIQTNKCKDIAENFSWVHTLCRVKEAEKLNLFRPSHLPPLQICIQVKLDYSHSRNGVEPKDVLNLAHELTRYPKLQLRGLMALPPISSDRDIQRAYFKSVKQLGEALILKGFAIDTYSMGMTGDFEAAIAEGSTIIRIGQGLFGTRSEQTLGH